MKGIDTSRIKDAVSGMRHKAGDRIGGPNPLAQAVASIPLALGGDGAITVMAMLTGGGRPEAGESTEILKRYDNGCMAALSAANSIQLHEDVPPAIVGWVRDGQRLMMEVAAKWRKLMDAGHVSVSDMHCETMLRLAEQAVTSFNAVGAAITEQEDKRTLREQKVTPKSRDR